MAVYAQNGGDTIIDDLPALQLRENSIVNSPKHDDAAALGGPPPTLDP